MKRLALILIFCITTNASATVPTDAATIAGPYACNGVIKTFTIPATLGLDDDDDLQVILLTAATGAEHPLTKTTEYTITSGNVNDSLDLSHGGTVRTVTAYPSTYQILLRRATVKTQTLNIDDEEVEEALDKLTRIVQDLAFTIGLCLKIEPSETGDTVQLPASGTAGYVYRAAGGNVTTANPVTTGVTMTTAWQNVTQSGATAPQQLSAQTDLGVTSLWQTRITTDSNAAEVRSAFDVQKRHFFDVTEAPYNAEVNGVTDDTLAIQAALDDANDAGGGTVFLPVGDYNITDTLTLYSNVRLVGAGQDTTTIIVSADEIGVAIPAHSYYCRVSDFTIYPDPNGSDVNHPAVIVYHQAREFEIARLTIGNESTSDPAFDYGLQLGEAGSGNTCWDGKVSQVYTRRYRTYGMYGLYCEQSKFESCLFGGTHVTAAAYLDGCDCLFDRCTFTCWSKGLITHAIRSCFACCRVEIEGLGHGFNSYCVEIEGTGSDYWTRGYNNTFDGGNWANTGYAETADSGYVKIHGTAYGNTFINQGWAHSTTADLVRLQDTGRLTTFIGGSPHWHDVINQSASTNTYTAIDQGVFMLDRMTSLQTKTVIKTIDLDDDASTDDYQFDDDAANTTEQVITLTNILPAYAELVSWQIRCFEGVADANTFGVDFGTTSGGTEIGEGDTDDTDEVLASAAGAAPALAATNAARSLYFAGTPSANWSIMHSTGRWAVMLTYIDYGAVYTQKNP